jgi:hypothetical protein
MLLFGLHGSSVYHNMLWDYMLTRRMGPSGPHTSSSCAPWHNQLGHPNGQELGKTQLVSS